MWYVARVDKASQRHRVVSYDNSGQLAPSISTSSRGLPRRLMIVYTGVCSADHACLLMYHAGAYNTSQL